MSLPALLDDGSIAAQMSQIQRARAWLAETVDPEQIADLAERARMGHRVLKIARVAEQLGREALRLQCEALRKLAQLDQLSIMKGSRPDRTCARWLGSLDDGEFERLMASCDPWHAASTLYHVYAYEPRAAKRTPRDRDTETRRRVASRYYPEDLRDAAKTLVLHLAEQDDDTTTADAALSLADHIGLSRDAVDDVRMHGLTEVVRQAIMLDDEEQAVRIDGREIHCPRFVSCQSDQEWIRVPWNRASLSQLRFMADHRAVQAKGVTQAASELRLLVHAAESRRKVIDSELVSELLGTMEDDH